MGFIENRIDRLYFVDQENKHFPSLLVDTELTCAVCVYVCRRFVGEIDCLSTDSIVYIHDRPPSNPLL